MVPELEHQHPIPRIQGGDHGPAGDPERLHHKGPQHQGQYQRPKDRLQCFPPPRFRHVLHDLPSFGTLGPRRGLLPQTHSVYNARTPPFQASPRRTPVGDPRRRLVHETPRRTLDPSFRSLQPGLRDTGSPFPRRPSAPGPRVGGPDHPLSRRGLLPRCATTWSGLPWRPWRAPFRGMWPPGSSPSAKSPWRSRGTRGAIDRYGLFGTTLVVTLNRGGREVRFRNLEEAYKLADQPEAFQDFLLQALAPFLSEARR